MDNIKASHGIYMSEHMSILLDKLKKLGTGDMDGPSVMLLESPEPTQELLALLASEFSPRTRRMCVSIFAYTV